MIIKGKSRSGATQLGPYLKSAEVNERIAVIEVRGTVADDVEGAIIEMAAYAEGTRCEKPLYHAQISPEPPYRLTAEQRIVAMDALEKELGYDGHARVAVIHQKLGREHLHVVWARIDIETMRAVSDSHNYRKHEIVSRELERKFGHPRVQGAHAERDEVNRPDRSPSRSELRQEERTGIKGKRVKEEVTAAFRASDSAEAFRAALEDKGYVLAQGDKRDFVIVDRRGGTHSLARRIDGINAAQLREFMSPIERTELPTAELAKHTQLDRFGATQSAQDQHEASPALSKAHLDDEDERAKKAAEIEADRRAAIDAAYSSGEDYVSQTQAARKDHKLRQDQIDRLEALKERFDSEERGIAKINPAAPNSGLGGADGIQPEASGGGRTRSR